jgi:hypothetical protein
MFLAEKRVNATDVSWSGRVCERSFMARCHDVAPQRQGDVTERMGACRCREIVGCRISATTVEQAFELRRASVPLRAAQVY